MNTLLLAPELFTTDSGIPRCLRLYLKALCDLAGTGDRVRFVTLNDSAIDSADLRPYSRPETLERWHACNRDKSAFLLSVLRLSAGTRLIVCGHVAQLPVAWLARWRRPGLRYVLVAHGIEVWRPFTFLERRALKGAWRIFCVSEFTRTELLGRIRLNPARVVVIPNALDPELAARVPATEPPTPRLILAVSRLSAADRYKGIDHLIEALPAILAAEPAARLRIVGRGDDRPRLEQLARDCGVHPSVDFVGYVDDARLRDEFARCALFALPSQKEGFGLVYLEAMTHGRPCVAALAGGAPEVVPPEAGILAPYGDVPSIAAACVKALRADWDPAAIRACAERFSYPAFRTRLQTQLAA